MRLAEATHVANEEQGHFVAYLVERGVGALKGKTIAIWGLAFKPETDDVRESPAVKLAGVLVSKGANVVGHDPEAGRSFAKVMASHGANVRVVERDYDALDGAHALVLLTEWRSYRAPNFGEIRKRLRTGDGGEMPIVVDGRNVWRPSEVTRAGLRYQGIGVSTTLSTSPLSTR
jgi:UDPglucose 6-dehydrogenase